MTHLRDRSCERIIKKDLAYSPCVGLLGMRQVGKTTLLKRYSQDYRSFDAPEMTSYFEREGLGLLQAERRTLALDEIQKYPPVFDMLKHAIDKLKKPGRFLVSGSVRFSSRKGIRESLTGRIILIDLHPLTLAECHSRPGSVFLRLLEQNLDAPRLLTQLSEQSWASPSDILHYAQRGGLPGICFRRDSTIRNRLWQTHLDTLLGRDIHLIRQFDIRSEKILELLTAVARNQGQSISLANYSRLVGVSMPTVKALFEALESLFLIKPFGNTYFIEDAGLSHYLSPVVMQPSHWDHIRLLHYQLREQIVAELHYQASYRPYQTRGGLFVPFFIEYKSGAKAAIFVDDAKYPSNKNLKAATWMKKKFPALKTIILTTSPEPFIVQTGIPCLPWTVAF